MASSEELKACYDQLDLPTGADLKAVEEAYFQIRGQMICAGQRQHLKPLKAAYHTLKQHLIAASASSAGDTPEADASAAVPQASGVQSSSSVRSAGAHGQTQAPSAAEKLSSAIAALGLVAKLSTREQTLHIGIIVQSDSKKDNIVDQLYQLFSTLTLSEYGANSIEIIRIYGLANGLDGKQKTIWKESFPTPNLQLTDNDADLYSFNNRISNAFIFPGLLLFAALLNSVEFIRLLLFGVVIWVHEFGHATVAWLCGYRAIPLPFGWTSTSLEQSLFVYFGVLTLLGLLFWTGKTEKRTWPMVLAVVLAVVQFWGTWLASANTYDLLMSFGGVGGEFYLSTLLIVSFYFPLPAYWRWDFYRYPAVLAAGFVFIGSAWRWQQIESGLQAIPWGSMLRGSGDMGGDMNRLVGHGWSDQQIINTYNSIGGVCIAIIVSVYIYFFLKQRNHLFLYAKWRSR